MAIRKFPVGRDIFERVAATFVEAAGAVVLADVTNLVNITDMSVWKGAGVAGLTAVLALAKSAFAAWRSAKSGGGGASVDPKVNIEPVTAPTFD